MNGIRFNERDHEAAAEAERRQFLQCVDALGPDELRVAKFVVARLAGGRKVYGNLDLARDKRNFVRERDEELADALVYVACEQLKRGLAP